MTEYATSTEQVAACWESNAPLWTELARKGYDVYRDAHNTPAFLDLLPDVRGLTGLDIGCGEGHNTRLVAALGADLTAIDVAPSFVTAAQAVEQADPLGINYRQADATALPFEDACFDFAVAFMCFMDVAHLDRALAEAHRVLKPGGFLQFSILHPCFAALGRKTLRDETGKCIAVELSDYFREPDGEIEEWTFSSARKAGEQVDRRFRVPRFDRTLSAWMNLLIDSGFTIERLAEPRASDEQAQRIPKIQDTQVVPMFLHVRVRKPN